MLFRMLVIATSLVSCGIAAVDDSAGQIGSPLEASSALYNAYGVASNYFFFVEKNTDRIMKVDMEKAKVVGAYSVSEPENEHTLLSNYEGAYVVDFSDQHLQVITEDGGREENPFDFQGTPISAAYNPESGILILQDDVQSIGLMILSESGEISKSWLGGPLMDTSKKIRAGDVDASGRLLVATSDEAVSIVDVSTSIDQETWTYTSFDTGIANIEWVAPDNGHAALSLVQAKDALAVMNVETQAITEQKALKANNLTIIGGSKLVKPHVIASNSDSGRLELYFIDSTGALHSQELPDLSMSGYTVSYLDADAKELTLLYTNDDTHRILKVRLEDDLVVLETTVESAGEAKLGDNLLVVTKDSRLGSLELHNLEEESVRKVSGFNFDYYRGKK